MRISIIAIGLCLVATQALAQIGYREVTPAGAGKENYDSSMYLDVLPRNLNVGSLVGQELYFPGGFTDKEEPRKREYDMKTSKSVPIESILTEEQKRRIPIGKRSSLGETNLYKPVAIIDNYGEMIVYTPRAALENKTFKIVKAVEEPHEYILIFIATLQDENGETFEWRAVKGGPRFPIPFYIVANIVKVKNDNMGKKFYKDTSKYAPKPYTNWLDEKPVVLEKRTPYTFVDYSFLKLPSDDRAYNYWILKDTSGRELTVWPTNSGTDALSVDKFFTEEEFGEILAAEKKKREAEEAKAEAERKKELAQRKADAALRSKLVAKYGQKTADKVLNGNVDLGMNQELCKAAWGTPASVSKHAVGGTTLETWHYAWGRHLTFTGGKLTGFSE